MKFYIIPIVFILFSGFLRAQDLSGTWRGKLIQEPGALAQVYYFEMIINKTSTGYEGTSKIYVEENFGHISFSGTLKKDVFKFEEHKILNEQISSQYAWCIKHGELKLTETKTAYILQGPWSGYSEFGTCRPGEINIKKIKQNNVTKPQKEDSLVVKKVTPKEVVQDNAVPSGNVPTIVSLDNMAIQTKREMKFVQNVFCTNQKIKISLYDHYREDNDTVTIYFNGNVVLEKHRLTNKVYTLELELPQNKNEFSYIMLHAENLGDYPPNTATLIVYDGKEKHKIVLSSDMEYSSYIKLLKKE